MKIKYLRDSMRRPVAIVGTFVDLEAKSVEYALSICNQIDRFDRKLGREIVAARLEKRRENLYGKIYIDPMLNIDAKLINTLVLTSIRNDPTVPKRVRRVAQEEIQAILEE